MVDRKIRQLVVFLSYLLLLQKLDAFVLLMSVGSFEKLQQKAQHSRGFGLINDHLMILKHLKAVTSSGLKICRNQRKFFLDVKRLFSNEDLLNSRSLFGIEVEFYS